MRKRDVRGALLLDHNHGRLYIFSPNAKPRITFLPENIPNGDVDKIYDESVQWKIRANRLESVRDFYREAMDHLQWLTDIVLVGPGTAKNEICRLMKEKGRFGDIPVRIETESWMDEPAFEAWAREKLNVPDKTPFIYMKRPRAATRFRTGSPGAPIDPDRYQRTNELKRSRASRAEAPERSSP